MATISLYIHITYVMEVPRSADSLVDELNKEGVNREGYKITHHSTLEFCGCVFLVLVGFIWSSLTLIVLLFCRHRIH